MSLQNWLWEIRFQLPSPKKIIFVSFNFGQQRILNTYQYVSQLLVPIEHQTESQELLKHQFSLKKKKNFGWNTNTFFFRQIKIFFKRNLFWKFHIEDFTQKIIRTLKCLTLNCCKVIIWTDLFFNQKLRQQYDFLFWS